jgi:hypothetical protein
MMVDGQGLIIELLSSSPAPDLYAGGKAAALALQQACLLLLYTRVLCDILLDFNFECLASSSAASPKIFGCPGIVAV